MTPKEKAKELVDYFWNIEPIKLSDFSRIYLPTAKHFAIKVCDEVMESNTNVSGYTLNKEYWTEVKREIESYEG